MLLAAGAERACRSAAARALVDQVAGQGVDVRVISAPPVRSELRRRRGRAASALVLLGALVRYRVATSWRRRRGPVIVDGGWWDLVADPVAHGLHPDVQLLARALGVLAPRADVLVHIRTRPPSVPHADRRYDPAGVDHVDRWWAQLAPTAARSTVASIAGSEPASALAAQALAVLDGPPPAMGSDGDSWITVPLSPPRREMQSMGGRAAVPALELFRPVHPVLRAVVAVNRPLVARGIAPPSSPAVGDLRALFASVGVDADGIVVMQSRTPGRVLAAAAAAGRLAAVAKVGDPDDAGLHREADLLVRVGGRGRTFCVPELRWSGRWREHFVVVLEPLSRLGAAGRLDPDDVVEVCIELSTGLAEEGPLFHGDFTPWNVLPAGGGVAVIDWESAAPGVEPMRDLTYFVIRKGVFAKGLRPRDAVSKLTARGSAGWRYLEGIGVDPTMAPTLLLAALDRDRSPQARVQRYQAAMRAAVAAAAR